MMSLAFLVSLLLCSFIKSAVSEDKMALLAKEIGLSRQDFESCLNKANVDLEMFLELSDVVSDEDRTTYPEEAVKKVGTVTACIFQIQGVLRNSRMLPDKFIQMINRRFKENPPPQVIKIINKCCTEDKDGTKTEDYEIAFNFISCFKREMLKMRT